MEFAEHLGTDKIIKFSFKNFCKYFSLVEPVLTLIGQTGSGHLSVASGLVLPNPPHQPNLILEQMQLFMSVII